MIDKDGDGAISVTDLNEVLSSLGQSVNEQTLQSMIAEVNTQQNGNKINFKDFYSKLTSRMDEIESLRLNMSMIIRAFDSDGSGYLDADMISDIFQEHFEGIRLEDINAIILECHPNDAGQISYEEFLKYLLYPV